MPRSYFPSYAMRRHALLRDIAFARRLGATSVLFACQLRLAELRSVAR